MSKTVSDRMAEDDARTMTEWNAEVSLRALGSFLGAADQDLIEQAIKLANISPKAAVMVVQAHFVATELAKSGITKAQMEERTESLKAKTKAPFLMSGLMGRR